jgi:hypothetical protein
MSTQDWEELFRYLLARLEERGLTQIRAEIEVAATAPVFEESTPEEDVRISAMVRGEVGKAYIRRRTASEMFNVAVGVLYSRLIEVPVIADSISRNLKRPPEQVEFRPDTFEAFETRGVPVRAESVSLARMSIAEAEMARMSGILVRLGAPDHRMESA